MLELLEHFIAIVRPSLAKRGADFLSGFWRMFIALGRSRFLPRKRTASQCCSDAFKRFFGMSFSPKGIVLPGKLLALAFQRFAGHSIVIALQIICCSVYLFAANEAGEEFAGSRWCHISDNGVNSVDTPLYQIARNDARAIPSEAAQECAERVTTRAWSPERTVKPHEHPTRKGRDSLSYEETHRSADKEPHGNTLAEALNISPADVISASQWSIKQAAVAVTINGLEELQNSGEEQIIDLFDARVDVAESSIENLVANGIYSDGTGTSGKQITGLQAMVVASTGSGTVGGIDRGTWSFWRNQTFDFSSALSLSASATTIGVGFNTLYSSCVRGSDVPDLIMLDNAFWGFYEASLQNLQRFPGDAAMAQQGFVTTKYMNADVVLDGGIGGNMPTHTGYFLNTKYLFYRPHRARNFVPIGDDRMSTNQDAIVRLIGWAGNMTASGLQFQGIMVE